MPLELPPGFDDGPIQLWTARPSGELDYVNHVVERYFGLPRTDLLHWGWTDLVHPDDLDLVGERWGGSLETGMSYRVEFRLRRHDGRFFWHLARAEAQRNAAGNIVGWLGANVLIEELMRNRAPR